MLQLACTASKRLPRPPGEPRALSEPLLSALQLVNRLGSKRGGAELFMQSPALQAREQHHVEQLAAVEGECFLCQSRPGLDPPYAWAAPGGVKPSAPLIRAHFLDEGKQGRRRGFRG